AAHDEFKTEWWYYTGHLLADDGKKYGYELTFFRSGLDDAQIAGKPVARDVILTHFAVSDLQQRKFYSIEKTNRGWMSAAGASSKRLYVFNQGWSVAQLGDQFALRAQTPEFGIQLLLTAAKPPVVNGQNGVSQKAAGAGHASHYYSMTRLKTDG